jgi:hypothetical protein
MTNRVFILIVFISLNISSCTEDQKNHIFSIQNHAIKLSINNNFSIPNHIVLNSTNDKVRLISLHSYPVDTLNYFDDFGEPIKLIDDLSHIEVHILDSILKTETILFQLQGKGILLDSVSFQMMVYSKVGRSKKESFSSSNKKPLDLTLIETLGKGDLLVFENFLFQNEKIKFEVNRIRYAVFIL